MATDRRSFIKLAGLGALGVAAGSTVKALSQDKLEVTGRTPAGDVPQQNPMTAKRWAMVVDTRVAREHPELTHKCVEACHHTHNVPAIEGKDHIKWMWEEHFEHAFHEQDLHYIPQEMQDTPTLLLCNHCDDPPCTQVCPTQATWKRAEDGIVMMDWHRCIGCRYCVVACPYGSRSFNFRNPRPHIEELNGDYPTRTRGVVEKCTFCEERLARGQMPACVEAAGDSGLITFGDLEDPESNVSTLLREQFAIRRKPSLGTQPEVYYLV